ncbi:hypothetical protein ACIA8R_43785 [Nonomuraea sp. NPDC051191]|uniref:hypothetical protein n=1 Tax=Nonomuraea sp. NPDC051191 TaxID=3364372 RepID=UPI003794BDFB
MEDEQPKITAGGMSLDDITFGYLPSGAIRARSIEINDLARYYDFPDNAAYLASIGLPADATMDEVQLRLMGLHDVRGGSVDGLINDLHQRSEGRFRRLWRRRHRPTS